MVVKQDEDEHQDGLLDLFLGIDDSRTFVASSFDSSNFMRLLIEDFPNSCSNVDRSSSVDTTRNAAPVDDIHLLSPCGMSSRTWNGKETQHLLIQYLQDIDIIQR